MPPVWEVGGVMLKPFCLRHLLTLQSIEHPLVTAGAIPEPDDVVIALRICSSDLGIAAIEQKPTLKEKWLNAKMIASPLFMSRVIVDFVGYTEMYSSVPKLWEKPEDGESIDIRKNKVPEVLLLTALLIRKTTITEPEVWTMPIGKLSWYATALAVLEGANVDTISTEDEKKFESEQAELARFQAGELAKAKQMMANGKHPLTR